MWHRSWAWCWWSCGTRHKISLQRQDGSKMHKISHTADLHLWLLVTLMLQNTFDRICTEFSCSFSDVIALTTAAARVFYVIRCYRPLSSRWRTRGRLVCGADGGEGQSWWCQSPDPGEWRKRNAVRLDLGIVFGPAGWEQVSIFGHLEAETRLWIWYTVTHVNHCEHIVQCSAAFTECVLLLIIILKYSH